MNSLLVRAEILEWEHLSKLTLTEHRAVAFTWRRVLGSKQESLNRRVRETLSSLSDGDLVDILKASTENYTPFARKVAEAELSSRSRLKARTQDASGVHDLSSATTQPQPAFDGRLDCFIEIWSERNFKGEHMRIEGPVECQTLRVAGPAWGDTISSLRVGPTAFVLAYAEKEFQGAMISFGPGQEAPDLDEFNFNDQIDSITVSTQLASEWPAGDLGAQIDVRAPLSLKGTSN